MDPAEDRYLHDEELSLDMYVEISVTEITSWVVDVEQVQVHRSLLSQL